MSARDPRPINWEFLIVMGLLALVWVVGAIYVLSIT